MPDDTEESQPDSNDNIKRLRERAKAADEAEARAALAERRAAMAEAGIPSTKIGQMFKDSYKGDLDADQIKAAWAELGIEGTASPQNQIPDDERRAHERMAQAQGEESQTPGRVRAADLIAQAKSPEEVEALFAKAQRNDGWVNS